MEYFNLDGEVAVVTGGCQGIGLTVAGGLAEAGATVVLADINYEKALEAAEELKNKNFQVSAIEVDVTKIESLEVMVDKLINKYGKIDVLINCAGVLPRGPVEDVTEEDWDLGMAVNLKGLFFACQIVGKEMIKKKKGKIINLSSNVSQIVMHGTSVYSITKAGVSQLTRCLAVEWGGHNIHVNAIGPGPTMTEMTRPFLEANPDILEQRKKANPLGRMGSPSDYVGISIFLASQASDFITGQTYLADGGSTIW